MIMLIQLTLCFVACWHCSRFTHDNYGRGLKRVHNRDPVMDGGDPRSVMQRQCALQWKIFTKPFPSPCWRWAVAETVGTPASLNLGRRTDTSLRSAIHYHNHSASGLGQMAVPLAMSMTFLALADLRFCILIAH